jgi:hypothetical protein
VKVIREYSRQIAHEQDGDLRFRLETPEMEYRAQLILHEHERLIRLYVFPDSIFYVERSREISELVAAVSDQLVFGSLEWDADKHFVYFRNACIASEGHEAKQLRSLLESCVFAMNVWSRAFQLVNENGLSPNEACNLALVKEGVSEPLNLSNSAMKYILTLHTNR